MSTKVTEEFIVIRSVCPGIPFYVRTDRPIEGERIYHGEFKDKTERRGLNEPFTLKYCEPLSEVTFEIYRS